MKLKARPPRIKQLKKLKSRPKRTPHISREKWTYPHVVLNTSDITRCLQDRARLPIVAQTLDVFYVREEDTHNGFHQAGQLQCTLQMTGPPTTTLSVLLKDWHCSDSNHITISHGHYHRVASDCYLWISPGLDIRTPSNSVNITITVTTTATNTSQLHQQEDFSVTLNVQALALGPDVDSLVFRHVTPTLGYVQSTNFDPARAVFSLPVTNILTVTPNLDFPVALITFVFYPHFELRSSKSEINTKPIGANPDIMNFFVHKIPTILRNKSFRLQCGMFFYTGNVYNHCLANRNVDLGYRLMVSYHKETSRPVCLYKRPFVWNCSVPFWDDFKAHFLCDMVQDCAGGEDEMECPQTRCAHQGVRIDGTCYVITEPKRVHSWVQQQRRCRAIGGYLASLNSPREWEQIRRFLTVYTKTLIAIKSGSLRSIGLRAAKVLYPEKLMYSGLYLWDDGTLALYTKHRNAMVPNCGYMQRNGTLKMWGCYFQFQLAYELLATGLKREHFRNPYWFSGVCELPNQAKRARQGLRTDSVDTIIFSPLSNSSLPVEQVLCQAGHLTHAFLACDVSSFCWKSRNEERLLRMRRKRLIEEMIPEDWACPVQVPIPFSCGAGGDRRVPYSVVCDHRKDCLDNSDELFCVFPICSPAEHFQCRNGQCIAKERQCDKMEHCVDSSDERDCITIGEEVIVSASHPSIIDLLGGSFVVREELRPGQVCPSTHFSCPANGHCLPVYLRCNDVLDCQVDESGCKSLTCSGFYRCRGSFICLHPDHVCDGWTQCPQHDDELFCDFLCPQGCSCHGLAFTCFQNFETGHYTDLRYLNASGSGIHVHRLFNYSMLIYLNLAQCQVEQMLTLDMPNLHTFDLRMNQLHVINLNDFILMKNLQHLLLARNPITNLFPDNTSPSVSLKNVRVLDISGAAIEEIDSSTFSPVPNLQILDLSNNSIDLTFPSDSFQSLKNLRALNISGFTMFEFSRDLLTTLSQLEELYTDNFKLCCPVMLPAMLHVDNCHAPVNELSSCESLLRSAVFRSCLGVFSSLAVLGNTVSFIIRVAMYKKTTGYIVFVTHLCVSDLLMGVYLVFVGMADHLYKDNYVWKDLVWRHSAACQMAGFLSFLSSEVSALIICLITLDRFLVLQFPFSRVRFGNVSAQVMMCVVWLTGTVLAGLPLLPALASWRFYSQTGICIPLPVTRKEFAGHHYSFGVMIILNFSLFLLIAVGQVSIFMSVRAQSFTFAEQSNKRIQDLGIARRLFIIILTDFMCWFPICVLGLLSSQHVPIAGEVNVALAIFVLPLNSVLNPFLYTINMVRERRQRRKEQLLLKFVQAKAHSTN